MRQLTVAALYALAAVSFSIPAAAQYFDGNDLFEACENESDLWADGFCAGYIAGTADTLSVAKARTGAGIAPRYMCAPEGVSFQQLVDIVKNSLRDAREDKHASARMIVTMSLAAAFPCP